VGWGCRLELEESLKLAVEGLQARKIKEMYDVRGGGGAKQSQTSRKGGVGAVGEVKGSRVLSGRVRLERSKNVGKDPKGKTINGVRSNFLGGKKKGKGKS